MEDKWVVGGGGTAGAGREENAETRNLPFHCLPL